MNKLNNLFLLTLAVIALAVSVPIAEAQNTIEQQAFSALNSPTAFSGAGVTNPLQGLNSNIVWYATPANAQGVPRFLSVLANGDIAAQNLTFYNSTNSQSITNAGIAGTNVLYCATGGFASNDFALIYFVERNAYQLVVVTNVGTGNLGISAGAKYATVAGASQDRIYKLTAGGRLNGPTATLTNFVNSGQPIYIGRESGPTVALLQYSNSAAMPLVVGDFWRQPRP